ncbi:transporter [Paracoccus sp. MBLB3053]|uniref:Transporter n=1 Tax=Paracoccus aurantius TaxID=3073814 RepID=A0ABU2HWY5_9RHOB|nr:transporter [Paracoccus sp. MBLB3053]MDS9469070.1 transporter [Paracoccus sp. MBLB3053]
MKKIKTNSRVSLLGGSIIALTSFGLAERAHAVEGATGFYILGSRTSLGGIVAPPGTYTQQSFYYYEGSNGAEIVRNGKLELGVDAKALLGLASLLWVPTTDPIMGGRPYLSLTLPYGYKDVSADGTLTVPGGPVFRAERGDDSFTFGDPVVGGGIGWGQGPVFGSLNFLVNVPIGDYSDTRSSNIAFNRWAYDVTGAVTWMNPETGWQANFATGVTFNGENDDTDYDSGNELHVEASVGKAINEKVTLSLQGYYYKQITGDSGDGALLGDFEGEVSALGPAIAWNSDWNGTPVSFEARWFHEFEAKNRLEGDAVLFNITIPLGG